MHLNELKDNLDNKMKLLNEIIKFKCEHLIL